MNILPKALSIRLQFLIQSSTSRCVHAQQFTLMKFSEYTFRSPQKISSYRQIIAGEIRRWRYFVTLYEFCLDRGSKCVDITHSFHLTLRIWLFVVVCMLPLQEELPVHCGSASVWRHRHSGSRPAKQIIRQTAHEFHLKCHLEPRSQSHSIVSLSEFMEIALTLRLHCWHPDESRYGDR